MSFKHKYTFEEKERILLEYQTGTHGFKELCRIYGMAEQALKDWIRLYETFGMEGLRNRIISDVVIFLLKKFLSNIGFVLQHN